MYDESRSCVMELREEDRRRAEALEEFKNYLEKLNRSHRRRDLLTLLAATARKGCQINNCGALTKAYAERYGEAVSEHSLQMTLLRMNGRAEEWCRDQHKPYTLCFSGTGKVSLIPISGRSLSEAFLKIFEEFSVACSNLRNQNGSGHDFDPKKLAQLFPSPWAVGVLSFQSQEKLHLALRKTLLTMGR